MRFAGILWLLSLPLAAQLPCLDNSFWFLSAHEPKLGSGFGSPGLHPQSGLALCRWTFTGNTITHPRPLVEVWPLGTHIPLWAGIWSEKHRLLQTPALRVPSTWAAVWKDLYSPAFDTPLAIWAFQFLASLNAAVLIFALVEASRMGVLSVPAHPSLLSVLHSLHLAPLAASAIYLPNYLAFNHQGPGSGGYLRSMSIAALFPVAAALVLFPVGLPWLCRWSMQPLPVMILWSVFVAFAPLLRTALELLVFSHWFPLRDPKPFAKVYKYELVQDPASCSSPESVLAVSPVPQPFPASRFGTIYQHPRRRASRLAIRLYRLCSGLAAAAHASTVATLLMSFRSRLSAADATVSAGDRIFHSYCCASSIALQLGALFWFVRKEQPNIFSLGQLLRKSILLSPASAFLDWCAAREACIAGIMED
ncbi:uncharacterized protein BJ171DRAFT_510930 [Polychytrium aggregatum]|uniref:uncharacterized protein n=1 Tax=Polychytrium aggregatum TaxID=110093 RepID=UPI0022FF0B85|nr:uncharacterized protein BJ171DRAFT_510930 [Polychytrium aggregatum]KAI9203120.1 hypothetical protein BJ171DRAFT_510930 [Polychytrium aggregatum]